MILKMNQKPWKTYINDLQPIKSVQTKDIKLKFNIDKIYETFRAYLYVDKKSSVEQQDGVQTEDLSLVTLLRNKLVCFIHTTHALHITLRYIALSKISLFHPNHTCITYEIIQFVIIFLFFTCASHTPHTHKIQLVALHFTPVSE